MTTTIAPETTTPRPDFPAIARKLGPGFAARVPALDANDTFAADNFRELKEHRVFSAGIPAELGGGGATHRELCAMLREIGRHCGATALSLSMHTHLVMTSVFMYRQGAPVAPMLERIAADELLLVTSSASDWLDSNGEAVKVDGGYRVNAHKRFVSGSPAGDMLVSSVVYDDPAEGPTVLHFAIPMQTPGIRVLDNWRTMSMRASGSNDVVLEDVFLPDGAVSSRRPRGGWAPVFNVVGPVALPLMISAYMGVADASREIALSQAERRRDDENTWYLVGEMENLYTTAEIAVQSTFELCNDLDFTPSTEVLNAALVRKTIAVEALIATVEKALEVAGGGGIFRSMGLERLVREIHAAQFHPLQAKRQHRLTGRVLLGLDPVG